MVDVANQGEFLSYMLGGIGVLFIATYFLVTRTKKDSDKSQAF